MLGCRTALGKCTALVICTAGVNDTGKMTGTDVSAYGYGVGRPRPYSCSVKRNSVDSGLLGYDGGTKCVVTGAGGPTEMGCSNTELSNQSIPVSATAVEHKFSCFPVEASGTLPLLAAHFRQLNCDTQAAVQFRQLNRSNTLEHLVQQGKR